MAAATVPAALRHGITTLNPDEMLTKIADEMRAVLTYDHIGIGIMDYGKIIALDTSPKLKETLAGDVIVINSSNLDALAVIHPQNVSPKLQFAIDQFLLAGKPVFLAVDPASQHFKRQSNPQQQMMGGGAQNVSSDLPALLSAYGIAYDPQKVVGYADAREVTPEGGFLSGVQPVKETR